MITKQSNILDWPQKGLNPQIWDDGNILRPDVKQFILDFIHSFAQANNFKDTFAWLTQVKFVGSLTTNLWNSRSDVDIHCEVDLPKFVEIERPEMTEKEASDYLDGIRKQVDQVKAKVPGTEHPLEIYFETEFTTRASQQFSGTYSVLENKWLSEPHIVGEDFDIATLHPELLNLAKETAAELDEAFGELKQNVQDIKELAETIGNWPAGQRELLEKKLQKRLDELEKEIKDLVIIREDVAEKRKHYNAISEQEVRFKYLQKYYYMHVLTDLKALLKQSPELEMKDIPVVENIMAQASFEGRGYFISPEGELFDLQEEEGHFDFVRQFYDTKALQPEKQLLEMLGNGWARVREGDYEIDVEVADILKMPVHVEEFLTQYPEDTIIYIDDHKNKHVSLEMEDISGGLQKAINKALQHTRMQQASLGSAGQYWFDPNGKFYSVELPAHNHTEWIQQNAGIDSINDAIEKGWIRARKDGDKGVIHLESLKNIPNFINDFILKLNAEITFIEDSNNNYIKLLKEDIIDNGIQEAVNKALQQKRMQTANLNKKAYDYSSYWVDPNGEIYNANESHIEWLANNLELLYNNYGIRFPNEKTPESMRNLSQEAIADYPEWLVRNDILIKDGWARVFVGDELAIQIKDLNNPPAAMENPFIEFAADTKGEIVVSDLKAQTVSIGDEDGFIKGIQKGLQEERMSQTASLKLAYQEEENRILVDMDDTICHEASDGECGEPMEGVKEALTKLKEMGYEIVIFSHRADDEHGEDEIKKYLETHAIPYDSIYKGEKPLARFQIDDRAIHFDNWNSVLKQIENSGKTANLNIQAIDAYYHGGSGASIRQMAKDGYVAAPLETGRGHQSPLAGRSYLTKDLGYALIYSLGGDMVGQDATGYYRNGDEGGVVLVAPNEDTLIPDEDWLGEKLTSGYQGESNPIFEKLKYQQALAPIFNNLKKHHPKDSRLYDMSYQSMLGKMAIRILLKYDPSYLKQLAKESHTLSHEGNLKVLKAWIFNKQRDNPKLKKDGSNFFEIAEEIPVVSGNLVHAAQDLPVINPKTFIRKEPYALFIGTQRYSKTVAVDLFDVYGKHPIVTPANQLPTVTLETLQKENIPVIGKELRAGDKNPVQDISSVYKQAAFNPYQDDALKQGPAYAQYIGVQPGVPELDIPDVKLYNIFGNHPRFGSTVSEETLKELRIPIREQKTAQLGSEYDYSSTHFLLPKEIAEKIIRWAVESIPEDQIVHDSKDPGTKGIQLESHITLKYGLLTDDFEEVKKALEGEKAPHIKFGKTSFFEPEGKDYDVVIIPVESEDLQKLNEKLCSQVEHEDLQFKEYHPHVTVAYVKRGKGKEFEGKDILNGEELDLDVLVFSPKEGEKRELELGKASKKEASSRPSYYGKNAVWLDPNGKIYKVENTHPAWILDNISLLNKSYHMNIDENEVPFDLGGIQGAMMDSGWIRIGDIGKEAGYGVQVANLKNIPQFVFDYLLKNPIPETPGKVVFDEGDYQENYVVVPLDELVEGQKAVNKALQQKRLQTTSSFMPSNTDLAPSNDWIGEVGYPGNSEMDAPQNKSDEETWYSPENDRPRSKNFLKRMLSLFQKPLSKKEPVKNIVPVKEASSNVFMLDTDSGLQTKALKDPTPEQAVNLFNSTRGEVHQLRWFIPIDGHLYMWDAYNLTHWDAIKQIGIPATGLDEDINTGVARTEYEAEIVAEEFKEGSRAQNVMTEEDRKFYRDRKQVPVQAKQWTTPKEPFNQPGMAWGWADYIYNYVEENWQDLLVGWLNLDPKNYVKPVVLIEKIYEDDGGVSAWVHIEFVNTAGNTDAFMKLVISADIHYEPSYEPEGVETHEYLENFEIEVLDYGKSDELEKTSKKYTKQDSEYWDTILAPFISDVKRDILSQINLKDFEVQDAQVRGKGIAEFQAGSAGSGKPLIYIDTLKIEKISKKEGIDFGYAIVSSIVHELGHALQEIDGLPYDEDQAENFARDYMDFGKVTDFSKQEKESSYGPTNYKGPSVADELYQDSPYRMNVTYSPEEDEELMDQNGKGGYPNRWMSRHRGPYYTNEGKVIKMLEETSAALSKKDIKKKAIGPLSGWLATDGQFYDVKGTHDMWIITNETLLKTKYRIKFPPVAEINKVWAGDIVSWLISKGWARVDGYPSHELDFQIASIKHLPQALENFIWKHNPKVVILEDLEGDDVALDDFSKGLDQALRNPIASLKQAAISGQVVNTILKLIEQSGGATYNIASNKNLVGTDAYAVAIYPDREQIVDGLDYDRLEGYLTQNEDLLANSNNSFGAWVSGGKTFLDVVATIADKNQAMELGRKHNQLAIFDLKNLVEIPLQRVASLKMAEVDIEHTKDWLRRHKTLMDSDGRAILYHATPKANAEVLHTNGLRQWSVLETDPSKAVFFAGRDRDLKPKDITLFEVHVPIDKLNGGVFASVAEALGPEYLKEIPIKKQAAAVSDREQQEYYNEIYRDRWGEDSSKIDGGNEYYDWSELGSNDHPNPKDEEKEHCLLDQLEKPINRNNPVGLGEYAITYYDAFPDQGDQGGI